MASKKELKRKIELLAEDRLIVGQSHKQYQDLLAKIIALMIDELGEDIVRAIVDEHEQPTSTIRFGDYGPGELNGVIYRKDGYIIWER